ncbi:hypothetical protein [Spirosoma endophyticum]|uniref:Uncharacterized protein n=1 Tax=Spirosoma endophyticum TaxID=662367 RepID=A0A1I1W1E3_9BACT|nr:hypothetical protein [Spirosoma endophyticum]SFD88987.1 hypothetical protein SAMN05216167_10889 [Spirosoma endophyticum]
MDNKQIKRKILTEYKALLTLKFDSPEVIKDKLKLLGEHIHQLTSPVQEENDTYRKAAILIKEAQTTEYVGFIDALTDDDKEQALAVLKQKASAACQLLHIHE